MTDVIAERAFGGLHTRLVLQPIRKGGERRILVLQLEVSDILKDSIELGLGRFNPLQVLLSIRS